VRLPAARHLLELGHRDIAVVAMPWRLDGTRSPLTADRRRRPDYPDATARLGGVQDVLTPVAVWECAASSVEEDARAATELLGAPGRPTPPANTG